MSIVQIATSIIEALTSALTGLLGPLAEGIKNAFVALFMDKTGDTQSISIFGIVMLIFGGIALAIGISRLVFNIIRSKVG